MSRLNVVLWVALAIAIVTIGVNVALVLRATDTVEVRR